MKLISSRQNPIVRAHRELASEPDPAGARLLLDGVHLVRDAQAAGLRFESIAIAASRVAAPTEEGDLARALDLLRQLELQLALERRDLIVEAFQDAIFHGRFRL